MTKETSLPAKQRIWELDALRGLCILCMVIIHAFWDLSAFGGFTFDLPGWFLFCRQYGHILFILLSGLCATLASRSFQRGVYVFGAALVISYVTFFMVNVLNFPSDMLIWFGILHLLGVCMMLFPLFKRLPVWALAVLGVGFVALGVWFESFRIPVNFLFPLGLRAQGFYCGGDYFPLLPWFFVFLLGTWAGRYVKAGRLPQWFYTARAPRLALVGRHALVLYVLHQPALYALTMLLRLIFIR